MDHLPAAYDCIHVAVSGHLEALIDELQQRKSRVVDVIDPLVFEQGCSAPAAWAQNTWLSPRELSIQSIGEGARALRSLQRNWHLVSVAHHRRAQLIADRLPPIRFRALRFPAPLPRASLGAWSLIGRHRMVASARCSSRFANGAPQFIENREQPPNRAYLKLWEALTLAGRYPDPGERCLDLGAAPGGWTWVLAELGAFVISVDRADLDPSLSWHPGIDHRRQDAFTLRAGDIGTVDWICCDLIAYPQRLLELAHYWAEACPNAAIVLTVKCQGPVDATLNARFLDIPGGRLKHLAYNKHELTFFRLPGGGPPDAAHIQTCSGN